MKKIEQMTPLDKIVIENIPNGKKRVLLRDNITEQQREDEGVIYVVYIADEYEVMTDEPVDVEYVDEHFDDFVYLAEHGETRSQRYADLVDKYVREKYTQSAVEAILNNYLGAPEVEKHVEEFNALQAWRAECKERAKAEV